MFICPFIFRTDLNIAVSSYVYEQEFTYITVGLFIIDN